jgi:hypothetical protein
MRLGIAGVCLKGLGLVLVALAFCSEDKNCSSDSVPSDGSLPNY